MREITICLPCALARRTPGESHPCVEKMQVLGGPMGMSMRLQPCECEDCWPRPDASPPPNTGDVRG